MKLYRISIYAFFLVFVLGSCYDEPEFPVEPYLSGFESIVFKENPEPGKADTLIIRVKFEDGDGDLGLSSTVDTDTPYNEISVVTHNGKPVIFNANDPDQPSFSCENYFTPNTDSLILDGWLLRKTDTVLVNYNKNGRNFDIQLLVKDQDKFAEYNFRRERCVAPLGGRFPRLKDDFNNNKPLKGILEYKQISSGILPLFRNDSLKIRVQIRDRALHESNIIESEPFTLRGIEVKATG